jgi:hypothetical protein
MPIHTEESGAQKAAEIVVVGPKGTQLPAVLHALCHDARETDSGLMIAFLPVTSELTLYLYGVSDIERFAWDLVGRKMLGYVVIFDWFNPDTFHECCRFIDLASANFSAPFIVAADHGMQPLPVPENALRPDIALSPLSRFVFFQSHKPASVRKVLVTLMDVLLEKLD